MCSRQPACGNESEDSSGARGTGKPLTPRSVWEDEPLNGQRQASPYHRRLRSRKVKISRAQTAQKYAGCDGGEISRSLKENQQSHQQLNKADGDFHPPAHVFFRGPGLRHSLIDSQLQTNFLASARHNDRNRMVERGVALSAYGVNYVSHGSAIYIDDSVIPLEPGGIAPDYPASHWPSG